MKISTIFTLISQFSHKERQLLKNESERIGLFCTQIFWIVSIIVSIIFAVLVFCAIPFFNATYLLIYLPSFFVFATLSILFYRCRKTKANHYLPLVYFFVIYLYAFSILISISSTGSSHAATSFVCFQVIFPLLLFDRSLRVNTLCIALYIIHSFLAYRFKDSLNFVLDVSNGAAFTVIGILIGEYERYAKLTNFEKDRILVYQKSTDMLTELKNRHMLFERLSDVQDNYGSLSGIFMIDIDHFKLYNDTFGHQMGDTCLKTLGKKFAEFGNENGFEFYRYGGEEFCALTTKYSYDELREKAELLRKQVQELAIPFEKNESGIVTISVGFAQHYYTQSYETTIKQADDALYNAKETGRNRIFGNREL